MILCHPFKNQKLVRNERKNIFVENTNTDFKALFQAQYLTWPISRDLIGTENDNFIKYFISILGAFQKIN
jgi:hypothetical protein